jgi:hypothetical protein
MSPSGSRIQGLERLFGSSALEHPWSAAWLLTTLGFAVFFLALDPVFDVPDDPFIMFVLDGFFYGEPDYHTIYISTLLTRGLAQLYAWLPDLSWYGVTVYGLHFAAVVVWLSLFLRQRRAPVEIVLLLLAAFALTLPMLLEVTYSSAALAAGAMGIFLHFERSGEAGSGPGTPILAGAMLGFACLVRDAVAPALLLPAIPMLAFRARRVPLRRHALALAVFLTLILGGRWSDSLAYAPSDWQAYLHRFALCFELHATPRIESTPELVALAAEAGWSENDLRLFTGFIYADPEVYSESSLSALVEGTAGLSWARNPLRAARDRIIGDHSIEVLLILLHLVILVPRMKRRDRWIALLLAAGFGAGALYLAMFQRFPSRLALPITWMVVSWLVSAPHEQRETLGWIRNPRTRRVVGRSLAALLIAVPLVEIVSEDRELREERELFLSSLQRQAEVAPNPVVIAFGELPFDLLSPMTTPGDLPRFDYVGVGWRVHSPPYDAHLEKLGIENVYLAPLERDDVFLAIREDVYPLYQEFVREHYQRVPDLEPLFPIDDRMFLYGKARWRPDSR